MIDATSLLAELEPNVEQLLERHLAASKEWFPHEHVPYGRGRDPIAGETWSEDDADLAGHTIDDAVRSSLLVNLLTEDNLPYYFRTVEGLFGADGPWGTWVRRWTAEEGRHAMAIYGYLMATRAIDPHHLERCRMAQVSRGETPDPATLQHGFVYLALQELATRIAHRSTGRMMGDPAGYDVMMRVAGDENLHQLFYRDLAAAAIEVDPFVSGAVALDLALRVRNLRRAVVTARTLVAVDGEWQVGRGPALPATAASIVLFLADRGGVPAPVESAPES